MNELVPMSDIEKMGSAIAKSGLFGMKTPEQAIALMLIAQAEGMHPAIAARDYHVIQGRPALKADAMLARFQSAGGKVQWEVYTDEEVKATFSHPAGGTITLSWTLAQAKKIGLATKDSWKNYPRAMLRARVISEGIRTVYPGCVVGVYTPEEVGDFEPRPANTVRNMGNVEVVDDAAPNSPILSTNPIADMVDDIPPAPLEQWTLQIPGKKEQVYHSKTEWIDSILALVDKVLASKALSVAEQDEKVESLKKANIATFQRIGLVESAEVYKQIKARFPREATDSEKKLVAEFAAEFEAKTI
jgi:hypothetical protein